MPLHFLTEAVLLNFFLYVFTLHQSAFQPSKVVRPLCGSGSRNFKTSYRCPIISQSHPYRCQLSRYWARVTLLLSVPTNQHAYHHGAQAAFSDFRNEGHSQLSPGSLFHSKAFQSAFVSRLKHCRSSIFFQWRSRTQRHLHWSVDMNQ